MFAQDRTWKTLLPIKKSGSHKQHSNESRDVLAVSIKSQSTNNFAKQSQLFLCKQVQMLTQERILMNGLSVGCTRVWRTQPHFIHIRTKLIEWAKAPKELWSPGTAGGLVDGHVVIDSLSSTLGLETDPLANASYEQKITTIN